MSAAGGQAWPAVIVGGAPRAGTSSIFDLLQGTGAFGRQVRKELFLLNDAGFWIQGSTPGYAEIGDACYDRAGFRPEDRFIDASSTYLYQETAPAACAQRLASHPERALVVVFCLREPAERLYSNFRYFRDVLSRIPPRTTFRDYVDSLLDGGWNSGNQQIDLALEHGRYPAYLRRWQEAVGRRRILIVRTERMAEESHGLLAEVGSRVGASLTAEDIDRRNAAYRPRSTALHAVARRLGSALPHGRLRERLKDVYVRAAAREVEDRQPAEDGGALERVREHYRASRAEFAEYGLDWYAAA